MRAKVSALLVLLAAAGSLVPADAAAYPPQLNYDAAAVGTFPTADPCVVTDIQAEVLDFLPASQATQVFVGASTRNVCSAEIIHWVGSLDWFYTDTSGFTVVEGGKSADLNVTFDGYDFVLDRPTTITVAFHWESPTSYPNDGIAGVTGTITSDSGFSAVLNDSIVWNRWGSELGPWAGLWRCVFARGRGSPGCLGQA
jgi:hypothetical protein